MSVGRRLAGPLSDVLFVVLAGTAAAALWRGYLVFAQDERPATDSPAMIALRAGVPLVVQGLMVLLAGKTVGELVVDLRTDPASFPRRLVKLLVGVVPLVLLAVVTVPAAQVALVALAVAAVVGAFLTRGHRGLSNAAAGLGAGDRRRPEASWKSAGSLVTVHGHATADRGCAWWSAPLSS